MISVGRTLVGTVNAEQSSPVDSVGLGVVSKAGVLERMAEDLVEHKTVGVV